MLMVLMRFQWHDVDGDGVNGAMEMVMVLMAMVSMVRCVDGDGVGGEI